MSTDLVKKEINRFLASSEPEVLCIQGKWGVGKTYTWDDCLKQAQQTKKIALPHYSYVSLFGINALSELKYLIFENKARATPYLCKAKSKYTAILLFGKSGRACINYMVNCFQYLWRKILKYMTSIPIIDRLFGRDATRLASFLTIRNQLICIDDLERRGDGLCVKDVLGLISFLREQRDCKIALILNSEQLEGDNKKEFEELLEKVVDISLVFRPTPKEAVQISQKSSDNLENKVEEQCVKLGITNIRIINKIKWYVKQLPQEVIDQSSAVFDQAISSLVLFAWSHLQPNEAPTLEYIKTKFGRQKEPSEQEASWNALLIAYDYTRTDFDLALIKGVKNGFFDSEALTELVEKANSDKELTECREKVTRTAWTMYRDSFDDNQADVLNNMYSIYMENMKCVAPNDINSIVMFFNELGCGDRSAEMLDKYCKVHNTPSAFDLFDPILTTYEIDAKIIEKFNERTRELACQKDVCELLQGLNSSWSTEIVSAISQLTVEEYYNIFKGNSGEKLQKILSGVFMFDRAGDKTPKMQEIVKRAREALHRIGKESAINARRVAMYGVKIESFSGSENSTEQADNI